MEQTAADFERAYAERSRLTVEQLRSFGRVVCRCDCGLAECRGWISVSRHNAEEDGLPIVWPPAPTEV